MTESIHRRGRLHVVVASEARPELTVTTRVVNTHARMYPVVLFVSERLPVRGPAYCMLVSSGFMICRSIRRHTNGRILLSADLVTCSDALVACLFCLTVCVAKLELGHSPEANMPSIALYVPPKLTTIQKPGTS